MVSNMNIEPKAEICDSNRPILQQSAISHSSIEFQMNNPTVVDDQINVISVMDTNELSKKMLKLELNQRTDAEKGSIDLEDEKGAKLPDIKSPKSPLSNSSRSGVVVINASGAGGRTISHQSSITSQVDVVEDRKALRDALYQGIFHRHRRTIFAVGSFLRMLRSRNSQYNTIRSNSEADEDTR